MLGCQDPLTEVLDMAPLPVRFAGILNAIERELSARRPGKQAIVRRLVEVLCIQVARAYLGTAGPIGTKRPCDICRCRKNVVDRPNLSIRSSILPRVKAEGA
jgi:hypothetical protein